MTQPTSPRDVALAVLRATPLVDGHNDLPWYVRALADPPGDVEAYDLRRPRPGHTDLERLRRGMVGAQFWSVYVACELAGPGAARVQLEQIDIARRIVEAYPEALEMAYTADDVERIFAEGRIGSLLGMEGGHAIESSLGALRAFHALGCRYMTLTHNCHTDWADAALLPPRHGGLTPFGRDVVREMNRLGMMVDLSHTSPDTMRDVLDTTEAPVLWTHAGARALVDHPRNVPDEILRRLPENGGVVMATFVPAFVDPEHSVWDAYETRERLRLEREHGRGHPRVEEALAAWQREHPAPAVGLERVADHIDHMREVAGPDHVGIGGDFDGITREVEGLEDVSTYPALFTELARRGWPAADLRKLAGENVLRAMRGAEAAASRPGRRPAPALSAPPPPAPAPGAETAG